MVKVIMLNLSYKQIEQLKYLSFIIMLIDHFSLFYFDDYHFGRIIGRLSAPVFFYALAIGFRSARCHATYLSRLLIWAFITQAIIWSYIGFKIPYLNILFTLAFCLSVLIIADDLSGIKKALFFIVSAYLADKFKFEYGVYSVFVVYLFTYPNRFFCVYWIVGHLLIYPNIQFYAVFTPLIFYLVKTLNLPNFKRQNFYFGYAFQWLFYSFS